jgi:hypothetical protein
VGFSRCAASHRPMDARNKDSSGRDERWPALSDWLMLVWEGVSQG